MPIKQLQMSHQFQNIMSIPIIITLHFDNDLIKQLVNKK